MSKLLDDLKKIKVSLPETKFFIPELNREVVLRGFSVADGRNLREGEAKKDGIIVDPDGFAYKTIAHSIVDGTERPCANLDGVALIKSLSEATVGKMIRAINILAGGEDLEKNSAATANGVSSSGLPATSGARLPN